MAEEKKKVEELESRGVGAADEDELADQLHESEREIKSLNQVVNLCSELIQKIAEVEEQLRLARTDFETEKEQLQGLALEHKSACERVENDLKILQDAYDSLTKELSEKEEELRSHQNEGAIVATDLEVQNLKARIQDLELEKGNLEDQIKSLQRDAAQLIEKDGRVAKERSEERKTLQTVLSILK